MTSHATRTRLRSVQYMHLRSRLAYLDEALGHELAFRRS